MKNLVLIFQARVGHLPSSTALAYIFIGIFWC